MKVLCHCGDRAVNQMRNELRRYKYLHAFVAARFIALF
jgi:hypothetical protein